MVAESDDSAIYFRFGTELESGWESAFEKITTRARKTQEDLAKLRYTMPAFDTGPSEKSFTDYYNRTSKTQKQYQTEMEKARAAGAKEQIRIEEELNRALDQAAAERMAKQVKWGSELSKQIDKDLASRKRAEADFVQDSHKLAESLANAHSEFYQKQAQSAEENYERASKALVTSSKQMEDALLKVGRGSVEVARGLTYLGAVSKDDAEEMLKLIVKFEALNSVAKGGITVMRGLADAWQKYAQVRAAAAAVEAAAGAAGGAGRAAGAAAGGAAGAAGGAAGGAGAGVVGGAAAAIGGAGMVGLGVGAVAVAGIVGTLYYFDKDFKAGVDKFLFGITDAEEKIVNRISAGEKDAEDVRERASKEMPHQRQMLGLDLQGIGTRARAETLADKSLSPEQRGLAGDRLGNSRQIEEVKRQLEVAQAIAAHRAQNAADNPGSQAAQVHSALGAQTVVDLTEQLKQLEQERLSITERTQQVAIDGMRKQLESTREQAAQMKQVADEAQRAAEVARNKYSSDLEKFGQADPIEQDKLKRIKDKLGKGETLSADESSLARGYNEFSDQAAQADRQRGLAAGGAGLFSTGGRRADEAEMAAAGAAAASSSATAQVAKIENEIRIQLDTDNQAMARQIAESLEPIQEQLVQSVVAEMEKRRTADAKAAADRRTKEAINASRS